MVGLKKFVTIDQKFFGGDQSWFLDERKKAGSCGVIMAANLWFYFRNIEQVSKERYMNAANSLYHVLSPLHLFNPLIPENTYGLPLFGLTLARLQAYLRAMGIERQVETLSSKDPQKIRAFLTKYLSQGIPVILLLIFHQTQKELNNHYMTITAFDEQTDTLTISSWGRKVELKLSDITKGSRILRLGVLK